MARLLSVNLGRVQPIEIEGRAVLSGIVKTPADGVITVRQLGLDDDEQADPTAHGGLSKALSAYPSEHHGFWQTVRAQAGVAGWGDRVRPGFLGENLTLAGLLENQVWVGDLLRFPACELAVSEPRYPCDKLNAVMGFKQAAELMVQSAWCGFYLAVRLPGHLQAGESFELVPGPREVGITELFRARTGVRR